MTSLKPFTESDFNVSPSSVQLGEPLGKGNFSTVYKGTFEGRQVAVKQQEIADSELERYLMNELAILRALKHEGCVKFYGAFRGGQSNIVNIITEWVEGGDLRRLVKDKSVQLGWKYRAKVILGCARALAYMHSLQLIHRDIKTENVLMASDGTPKLCDFGFARVWDKSKMMTMCGTDEFMAPEIIFGMQYDEKVDVYSFGIMLAEVCTRKSPGKREGFLDRNAGEGFNVNVDELDRETQSANAPTSLVLLTKECVAAESHDRLSAADIVAWLEDFIKECPADREPAPVLSGEAIKEKLVQYLAQEKAEEEQEEKDEEGESSLMFQSTTEETKQRIEGAEREHHVALSTRGIGGGGDAGEAHSPGKKSTGSTGATSLLSYCFPSSASKNSSVSSKSLEMSGWVTKRGGRIKTWKRRWMVLVRNVGLIYYKSPEEAGQAAEAQGMIEFAEMTPVAGVVANAVPTVMTGKANSFGVHTENRTYYIAAATPEERGKWIRAISDGHRDYMEKKNGKNPAKKIAGDVRRTRGDSNLSSVKIDLKGSGH